MKETKKRTQLREAKDTFSMFDYFDSPFANNGDTMVQLGYPGILIDKLDSCNILHYSSYKARRVNHPVLGGELYALTDAFDHAYAAEHHIEQIMGKHIALEMLKGSKRFFDVIYKSIATLEHVK